VDKRLTLTIFLSDVMTGQPESDRSGNFGIRIAAITVAKSGSETLNEERFSDFIRAFAITNLRIHFCARSQ
jgi:hypothetical protein